MINNRQGGRRRGRGGQRPQGMGGNVGNARDNRQRGNAAQLLEKYKGLARDAQLAGDRVQSEYYLQFADHYYRVLEEHRSRVEEQQQHRRRRDDDEDEDLDQDETADLESDEAESRPRPRRRQRDDDRAERPRRERSNGRTRDEGEDDGIAAILPPAIGDRADEAEEAEEEVKPRRRTRKPRVSDDGDGQSADAA